MFKFEFSLSFHCPSFHNSLEDPSSAFTILVTMVPVFETASHFIGQQLCCISYLSIYSQVVLGVLKRFSLTGCCGQVELQGAVWVGKVNAERSAKALSQINKCDRWGWCAGKCAHSFLATIYFHIMAQYQGHEWIIMQRKFFFFTSPPAMVLFVVAFLRKRLFI